MSNSNFQMPNMQTLMQQAQEMQSAWNKLEQEAARRTVEAEAGAGMVRVVATGRMDIKEIHIEPDLLTGGDTGMIEDLIQAAVNEALRRARAMMEDEMQKMAGRFNMPGLPLKF